MKVRARHLVFGAGAVPLAAFANLVPAGADPSAGEPGAAADAHRLVIGREGTIADPANEEFVPPSAVHRVVPARRANGPEDRAEVASTIVDVFGDRLTNIEALPNGRLQARVVDLDESDAEKSVGNPRLHGRVDLVRSWLTQAEIAELSDELNAVVRSHGGVEALSAPVDGILYYQHGGPGDLQAQLEETASAYLARSIPAARLASVPEEVTLVHIHRGDTEVSLTASNSMPPYRANKWINVWQPFLANGPVSGNCTTNFTFTRGGRYYSSTAGHCADVDQTWRAGEAIAGERTGPSIGLTAWSNHREESVEADIAVAEIPASWAEARIETGIDTGTYHRVTGYMAESTTYQGMEICYRGYAHQYYGDVCNVAIVGFGYTLTDTTTFNFPKSISRLVCHAGTISPGDSGGPAFTPPSNGNTLALGVNVGSLAGSAYGCYTSISRAMNELNSRWTSSADPVYLLTESGGGGGGGGGGTTTTTVKPTTTTTRPPTTTTTAPSGGGGGK